MTQQELADAVRMPQPSIARIERGAVIPRTVTLLDLLAATGHRLGVEPIGRDVSAADRDAIGRRLSMPVPKRTHLALGKAGRDRSTGPLRVIRQLLRFGVPFVLIGELAEAVHGSPARAGAVVEVCHASTDVARDRLALALEALGRDADPRRLRLATQTASGDDYEVLARTAVKLHVDAGILVRVAALEDLIRERRARATPPDHDVSALLSAIDQLR